MKTPIFDMLEKYSHSGAVRMHMPGHKGKGKVDCQHDVTELSFTDDLRNPSGPIMQSQKAYAETVGAKYCHYLVNGTSSGLMALVMACEGKILTEYSCHCSLLNSIRLLHKISAQIENSQEDGIYLPATLRQVRIALDENPETTAVFITSPDYYGRTADLPNIYKLCKSRKVKLYVDSAHGAHFGLSKHLPPNACENCDATVQSTHKTLPAFTQSAVLLTNDKKTYEVTKKNLNIITTTSPSFLLMQSIETAMASVSNNAKAIYDKLFEEITRFKENCIRDGWAFMPNDDFTRLVFDCKPKKYNGNAVYAALEEQGIFCEHATERYIVCIISPLDTGLTMDAFYTALTKMKPDGRKFASLYIAKCFDPSTY